MAGLKDKIVAAEDLTFQDEDVPEWGVKVRIRSAPGHVANAWEAKMVSLRRNTGDIELKMANYKSRFLVGCLYDPETDERIFADDEDDQLGAKSAGVIDRLFVIAQRLSGFDREAMEREKGNSESGQS